MLRTTRSIKHRRKSATNGALLAALSRLEVKRLVTEMMVTPHHVSNQWLPVPNNMRAMPAVKPAQRKINCLALSGDSVKISGFIIRVARPAAERVVEWNDDK
jgi:hypothetical protein